MSDDIPDPIEAVLSDEELANIRDRRGWATGTVAIHREDGGVLHHEEAYIELFNGEGEAGVFGGVRSIAVGGEGDVTEAYAYATPDAVPADKRVYAVVEGYTDPEDPDYGDPAP